MPMNDEAVCPGWVAAETLHICKSLAPADLIAKMLKRKKKKKIVGKGEHSYRVAPNVSTMLCLFGFLQNLYWFLCHPLFLFISRSDYRSFLSAWLKRTLISRYQKSSTYANSAAMHDTLIAF